MKAADFISTAFNAWRFDLHFQQCSLWTWNSHQVFCWHICTKTSNPLHLTHIKLFLPFWSTALNVSNCFLSTAFNAVNFQQHNMYNCWHLCTKTSNHLHLTHNIKFFLRQATALLINCIWCTGPPDLQFQHSRLAKLALVIHTYNSWLFILCWFDHGASIYYNSMVLWSLFSKGCQFVILVYFLTVGQAYD